MYYNYTDEQKYFLSVTDAMLKDGFSVTEIVEFWQSEDQNQVEGVLGSLTLTESVDYSNPDLALVCERFGLGWITRGATNFLKRLRGVKPKTNQQLTIPGLKVKPKPKPKPTVKNKVGQGVSAIKDKLNKVPKGVKAGAAIALGTGALLYTAGSGDNSQQQRQDNTNGPKLTAGDGLAPGAGAGQTKNYGWWKKVPTPYQSSKKFYDNIRK